MYLEKPEAIKNKMREISHFISDLAFSLLQIFPDGEVSYRFKPDATVLHRLFTTKEEDQPYMYLDHPSIVLTVKLYRMKMVHEQSETMSLAQFFEIRDLDLAELKGYIVDGFVNQLARIAH